MATSDLEDYLERTKRNHYWFGGKAGQQAIRDLKIGIAGLGGMGSNIAETLVRLGVSRIKIADPDHVDFSNLNRQVIANRNTVGKSKTDASAQELRAIAQELELTIYDQGITADNAEKFVEGCDAIVDEIDVFPIDRHVMLHRAAVARGIPLYSAYAVGLGIHFYKFHGKDYTFEDFLGVPESSWKKPTIELLFHLFGTPRPSYLDASAMKGYQDEAAQDGVPIFGPATLLGHSVVTTRLILDLMRKRMRFDSFPETPTMPHFLVLDPVDFTFRVERFK